MQSALQTANSKLFALLNTLVKTNGADKNSIYSPLSIYSCLAMVAEGTQGQSQTELQQAFGFGPANQVLSPEVVEVLSHFHDSTNQHVVIKMSNSLYADPAHHIKEEYKKNVETRHWATASNVNFSDPQTVQVVNDRITQATNGLLKNTIDKFDPSTALVLVNTIYFKGFWAIKFDKSRTRKGFFITADGTEINIPTMHASKLSVGLHNTDTARYLAIPYQGGELKIVFEVPNGKLDVSAQDDVLTVASVEEIKYDVSLPKFKATTKLELTSALKAFGVNGIFTGGLGGIADGPLAVTSVVHQAFIQVDEEGTEAAAATVAIMSRCLPPSFNVDSPFFYHIVDTKRKLVLFSGTIVKPEF